MRIISLNSKEVEKRKVCKNCGAEIGFFEVDVHEEELTDYTGDTDINRFIVCPNCSKKISIPVSFLF